MCNMLEPVTESLEFDLVDVVDEAKGPLIGVTVADHRNGPKWVNIKVDDWHGNDRKQPRVTIEYNDGSEKSFNILESILANSASIGHPLILVAIRRWEKIIQYYQARSRDRKKTTPVRRRQIERYTMAKNHLRRVGQALLKGAQARVLSKEMSFTIQSNLDFFPESPSCLFLVWKMLGEDEFKTIRNIAGKKRLLREKLSASPEAIDRIIAFFESTEGHPFLQKRSAWKAIKNAFDSWRFGYPIETVKKYRSAASSQEVGDEGMEIRSVIPEEGNKYNVVEQWLPSIRLKPIDR
jgi:hypothetical protein